MSKNRIDSLEISLDEVIYLLTDGSPDAITALDAWRAYDGDVEFLNDVLSLDTKRLYGKRIWELYHNVCGEDLERFKYHLKIELPDQETGEVWVSGSWHPSHGNTDWWERRRFGKPNSFWALEHPPTDPNYEFPIG